MGRALLSTAAGDPMSDFNSLDFDFEAEVEAKDAVRDATLKAEGNPNAQETTANTRGRFSTVCRHWLRNLCVKGDKCDYIHRYDLEKMPECSWWLKLGKCNDPDCIFRHVQNNERPVCHRYRLGFCRLGPLCRSRHDRLPRDYLPDVLPDSFLDAVLQNAHLVPRAEQVGLRVDVDLTRERARNATPLGTDQLALGSSGASTEVGTVPGLLEPIHGKCRYFFVRSMTTRNIQISLAKGIWATTQGNCQQFRKAFKEVDHVILIFTSTESRHFEGYAKLMSEPDDFLLPGIWGEMSCRLSANFRVHWIKQCSLQINKADNIKYPARQRDNGSNEEEMVPVRRSRDGQELPSLVGERLCRFLWQQPGSDLLVGSEFEFERVDYSAPVAVDPAGSTGAGATGGPGAPLAIEDGSSKDGVEADRLAPAPARIGTFSRDASWMDQASTKVRSGGPAPLTVGMALASGSSSIMAGLAQADRPATSSPGAAWTPPVPSVATAPPPGYYQGGPPPGYPPHPHHPGYYPPPGPYGVPPGPHQYPTGPHHYPPPGPLSAPPATWGHAGQPAPGSYDSYPALQDSHGQQGRPVLLRSRSRSRRRRRRRE